MARGVEYAQPILYIHLVSFLERECAGQTALCASTGRRVMDTWNTQARGTRVVLMGFGNQRLLTVRQSPLTGRVSLTWH